MSLQTLEKRLTHLEAKAGDAIEAEPGDPALAKAMLVAASLVPALAGWRRRHDDEPEPNAMTAAEAVATSYGATGAIPDAVVVRDDRTGRARWTLDLVRHEVTTHHFDDDGIETTTTERHPDFWSADLTEHLSW